MLDRITIDFETRSHCDLKKSGAWRYSIDATTEILCLSYRIPNHERGLWVPSIKSQIPEDLLCALDTIPYVEAHNSFFELCIWENVGKRYGLPPIDRNRWICSAAKAAALSLPRDLNTLAKALRLPVEKDMTGHRLMLKMSKPRKITKNNANIWHEDPHDLIRLAQYCEADTETEESASNEMRDLSVNEREMFLLDQTINLRGVHVDVPLIETALDFIDHYSIELTDRLREISGGEIQTAGQRDKTLNFLREKCGLELPNLQAATVADVLEKGDLNHTARAILEIRQSLSKSSTKKLQKFLDMVDHKDNRIRGTLLYHGASTGRWCLTPEHEVLTPEGWKNFTEWKGQEILVFDPESRETHFEKVNVNSWDFKGNIFSVDEKYISFRATKEHKIGYYTSKDNFNSCKLKDLSRGDVVLSPKRREKFSGSLWVRLLVMIQADGHFMTNKRQGRGLRFRFKKERKIHRATTLLNLNGLKFSVFEREDATEIKVRFRDIPKHLWDFKNKKFKGHICYSDCHTFIDELPFWDGHRNEELDSFEYSTCDKSNAFFASTMAHLSGMSARVVKREKQNENWSDSFRVFVKPSDRTRLLKKHLHESHYGGRVYCPETSTGFFMIRHNGKISITGNSGKGIQPQNFPRGTIKDVDDCIETMSGKDFRLFRILYPDVLGAISSCLRGMICAPEGKDLIAADFSSIESRVLFWLAGEKSGLNIYKTHGKVYEDMAAFIYNKTINEIGKDSIERQLGKAAILGCGYQMGKKKFFETCLSWGIPVTQSQAAMGVDGFRTRFQKVVKFWYALNNAALAAIQNPGQVFEVGLIKYKVAKNYLNCRLPSGRIIAYRDPEIRQTQTDYGLKDQVAFMAMNSQTRKWEWQRTYGGKLAENVVQAVARDFMAEAMVRVEGAGYNIITTVHDEILCEIPDNFGSVEEFENLMAMSPSWGKECPIAVEGWRGKRFKK